MSTSLIAITNVLNDARGIASIVRGNPKIVRRKRSSDNVEFDMTRSLAPDGIGLPGMPRAQYAGIEYSSEILKKGHQKEPDASPLLVDMIFERNVPVPMRDGCILYANIFRPVLSEKVPLILVWSPYGKEGNFDFILDVQAERLGIPKGFLSGYENFEGPDPGFWVPKGYAVANIDIRGTWSSEGNLYFWGRQDGYDGYDAIEHLAKREWCSGSVGMAGNSWLAISQWYIASTQPPSLKAIAPWEGMSDLYRDMHRRGGIPGLAMAAILPIVCRGKNLREDVRGMAERNPVWNEYWEDKKAELSKITIPAYVLASYSSRLHCAGSFRGFRDIQSKEKWLRVHPYQEWVDFVLSQDDLAKFFDYYLKGNENDWRSTPTVRISLLRMNQPPIMNRPLTMYPPPCSLEKYYLDAASSSLVLSPPLSHSKISYDSTVEQQARFDLIFDQNVEIFGRATVNVHVQCNEADDLDVFVMICKLDASGQELINVNFPTATPARNLPRENTVLYRGPSGALRASHRAFTEIMNDGELYHPHIKEEKLSKGQIVELRIGLWPTGLAFEKGEGIRVYVSGQNLTLPEVTKARHGKPDNIGQHTVHTGGQFRSWVDLPILRRY